MRHAAASPAPPALLAAARAGDERAFLRLVEPYRPLIQAHCYRMLGSAQDAEDLTQETLLRAWRALGRFEGRAAVGTWLHRIATNACLDELERRPRRPLVAVDPYPDDGEAAALAVVDPGADPAARYALREGMQLALLTAIQRLPGRQRAVLILRDVLGWSAQETAEVLQSTVAGVNSALQRARATIADGPPARAQPARGAHRELLHRYVTAWERADVDGLVDLLREDAVLVMPPQPAVAGAAAIVAFFGAVPAGPGRSRITAVGANGRPALLLHELAPDGSAVPHRVLVLEPAADGRIGRIHAHADGAVLRAFASAARAVPR